MRRILKRLFFLPPLPTFLIALPAYSLVAYTLASQNVHSALAYASYFLSAYALIITMTALTSAVRFIRRDIKENPLIKKALGVPLVDRYIKEDAFRAEAALYQGFFINISYAGIKLFSGIRYRSVWFGTLAVYYFLLAVMRFSLLHHVRRLGAAGVHLASEWRRYRLCGMILLLMNVSLTGIIILVVYQNSGFTYPGMLIYAMALYSFYAVIMAVRNVVRFRKYGSPILSAAKIISLTAALVSMLSLETAMLTQFGAADDPAFRRIMTACTGAGISVIVLGMAGFMIAHATVQLKHTVSEKGR